MSNPARVSSKVNQFRPSLTLELKRMVQERLAAGLPVYDFGLGETKGDLPARIGEAGARAFQEGRTQYADPAGLPEVRHTVLQWLGLEEEYGVENVVITSGAKQALFNVILAVCNPGDTVLFDAAPWVSYLPQAAAASTRHLVVQPKAGDANYLKITGDDLRRGFKDAGGAKVFLLNSPVNPTGQVYRADEMFCTGTMGELAAVIKVDGRTIGTGERGPHVQPPHQHEDARTGRFAGAARFVE